ncbi:uncharacterized protein BDW47DRAFT_107177 [Aspergillus candidus]|uniref:Uncharacterized protein n=1 Tax=Aspergillus candidus TaxID=41067 RepID=A0A2I2F9G5_ASPCN|nr:hypothetical protein BDW47DRAFT_107177 [Aspergillus candidus]PLB37245.1 hypothetical protein BDW47DRAFT_107177 [Aspergillus candidus]
MHNSLQSDITPILPRRKRDRRSLCSDFGKDPSIGDIPDRRGERKISKERYQCKHCLERFLVAQMGLKLIPKSFIQKVVMVGGLSASPYLQMKLNQILDETPGNITMIVPPEP